MLHEILAQPPEMGADVGLDEGYNIKNERHGSEDSGYFSRRGSKATSTGEGKRDSVLTEAMEEIVEDYEGAEQADDEGADLEEAEDDEGDHHARTEYVSQPTSQTRSEQHRSHPHPHLEQSRVQVGSRFISLAPGKQPASPLLSADEVVMSRARRVRRGAFG